MISRIPQLWTVSSLSYLHLRNIAKTLFLLYDDSFQHVSYFCMPYVNFLSFVLPETTFFSREEWVGLYVPMSL